MANVKTQKLYAVQSGPDAMWAQRTATLLDALDGTGVDLTSDTLVDDVIAAGQDHPKISQFLVNLPGYPSDPAQAVEQLGYLASMAASAQAQVTDHG